MLVLLDENLPQRLRFVIPSHEVRTVAYQGWKILTNGALLREAEATGFEVMVTADQGIRYQQNMTDRKSSRSGGCMRGALIAGVVLVVLGAFVLIKGLSYTREESVFKFGSIEAKVQQERRIPEWIGGVALGAGLVLLVTSWKKR